MRRMYDKTDIQKFARVSNGTSDSIKVYNEGLQVDTNGDITVGRDLYIEDELVIDGKSKIVDTDGNPIFTDDEDWQFDGIYTGTSGLILIQQQLTKSYKEIMVEILFESNFAYLQVCPESTFSTEVDNFVCTGNTSASKYTFRAKAFKVPDEIEGDYLHIAQMNLNAHLGNYGSSAGDVSAEYISELTGTTDKINYICLRHSTKTTQLPGYEIRIWGR